MPFLATGFVPWLARQPFRGGAVGEPGTLTWDGEPETLVEVTDSAHLTVCFNNGTWLAIFGEGDDRVEALVYVGEGRRLHFWVRRRDASTGTWTWAEQATSADVPPVDSKGAPRFSKAVIAAVYQEVSTYAYVWTRRTRFVVAAPRFRDAKEEQASGLSVVSFTLTEESDGSDTWDDLHVEHQDIDVSAVTSAPEDVSVAVVPGASADAERVYVAFGGYVAGSTTDIGVWLWDSSTGSITELGVSDSTVSATLYPRLVSVAADPDRWVAVWRKQGAVDAGSGHTVAAATARHGAAMGTPDNVAGDRPGEADASDPAVAATPGGGFIVGHQQSGTGYLAAMALASLDGSTWSTAAEMSVTDTSAQTPFNAFVRPAASEAWTVAGWESREDPDPTRFPSLVYTASATNPTGAPEAAGSPSPLDPAVTTPGTSYDQTFPSPAILGDGVALVWRESDGATWRLKYVGGQL